jgi:hypothetical protein
MIRTSTTPEAVATAVGDSAAAGLVAGACDGIADISPRVTVGMLAAVALGAAFGVAGVVVGATGVVGLTVGRRVAVAVTRPLATVGCDEVPRPHPASITIVASKHSTPRPHRPLAADKFRVRTFSIPTRYSPTHAH